MSRTESSLLFSLQELRTLESDRASKERAERLAEQQRQADELAQRRAAEAEQRRVGDALRAALCERDAQMALAQRAVERHAQMAAELGESQARLAAAERALATPSAPPPVPRRTWAIVNGLLAVACLSLLTATVVLYGKAPVVIERTVPVFAPLPVSVPPPAPAPSATTSTVADTKRPRPTATASIRKPTAKPTGSGIVCGPDDDLLCGLKIK